MLDPHVKQNPYEPPSNSNGLPNPADSNHIGRIGFTFSLIGLLSLFALSAVEPFGTLVSTAAIWATFLSLPGLFISGLAMIRYPSRLAGWGVVVGLFGSVYLPTIYLTLSGF